MPLLLLTLMLPLSIADDAEYQAGQQLYESLEYEQANFRFQKLLLRDDLNDGERAQLILWGGLCYAGTGEMQSARAAFDLAFALDGEAQLPIDAVAPAVKDLAESSRADTRRKAAEAGPPEPAPQTPAADAPPPPSTDDDDSFLSPSIVAMVIGGVLLGGAVLILVGSASTAALGGTLFLNARALANDDNNDARDVNELVAEGNNLLIAAGVAAAVGSGFGLSGVALIITGVLAPTLFSE